MKIKKGDQVQIISGNDKGKKGKVIAVLPQERKIVVEGVNIKKKHVRPRSQGKKGELVKVPLPFSVSRAMLICGKCAKPTRAGLKINASRQKARVCKKCGGEF
ncbi:MAG: 50S ribosomal protein L24 [Candidatus Sungiibacteriota bacterium]|uniref:Large ribosomal subunit protein uL24 n=1 Tax=Candidatus Sungiibacteriota bacterium TaxID=2750080 RepID=A0A7T5USK5_9BACT|nr:MAG: 50S ribosomal protein L24 [Candidatus Sungbacteria bacterium]